MKKRHVLLIVVILITGSGLLAFFNADKAIGIVANVFAPDHDFDPNLAAPPPDYANPSAWAALPEKYDLSDLVPAGTSAGSQPDAPAAVFFIHPTAYLHGAHWSSQLQPNTATEENTQWMLANQASAYNGCCDVYAPYFREASIHAFFTENRSNAAKSLDFAYQDVARAFDFFIANQLDGKPFIIASHSQGTVHGLRLLKEKVDGTPLQERMIAAYLVGCRVPADVFESHFKQIKACKGPSDLHCVNAWDTYADGGELSPACPHFIENQYQKSPSQSLCVNPLSWTRATTKIAATENLGAVPILGKYNAKFWGRDEAEGVSFVQLGSPLPGHTWAQCRDGILYVEDQSEGPFAQMATGKNYHGLDYALFYMNIAENTKSRVNAWLDQGISE